MSRISELPNLDERLNRLQSGGAGGIFHPMEARVAKLESDTDAIKVTIADIKTDIREMRIDMRSDFKLLFGALITITLGLAVLMAKGFGWL